MAGRGGGRPAPRMSAPRLAVEVSVKVRPGGRAVRPEPGARVCVGGEEFSYAAHSLGGSDQQEAFQTLALPLVSRLRDGFDCLLMAYGQTGSGKTYTMLGAEGSLTEASLEGASARAGGMGAPAEWGLFPRVMLELLQAHTASGVECEPAGAPKAVSGERRMTLHASVIEIYQEGCYDLLGDKKPLRVGKSQAVISHEGLPKCAPSNFRTGDSAALEGLGGAHKPGCVCRNCWLAKKKAVADRLAKRDAIQASQRRRGKGAASSTLPADRVSSVYSGGTESFKTVGEVLWEIKSAGDVARLARLVEANRSSRSHSLNERSSRSHCIVRVFMTQHAGGGAEGGKVRGSSRRSTFQFVDLAGSERIAKSGMVSGSGRSEAIKINKSLSSLGRVVKALTRKERHVPYRESVLTVLLKDSLAGRSVMGVVICVASETEHLEESRTSLQYGARMARVESAPVAAQERNFEEDRASLERVLNGLKAELRKLAERGHGGRFGGGGAPSEQKSFETNVTRLGKAEAKVARLKQNLLEANARGAGCGDPDKVGRMLKEAQFELSNIRDIVLRQKSIKNFWIEPTPGFVKKEAEIREIEAKLLLLGAS